MSSWPQSATRLYDDPFLAVRNSGGALAMLQALLDHRRPIGAPQLVSNSRASSSP